MREQMLTTLEAAKVLRVHAKTLQRWDRTGELKAERSPSGRILYKESVILTVINIEKLSHEQEIVQDLMTIIHCYSSRLYGLRNHRKIVKDALANDH